MKKIEGIEAVKQAKELVDFYGRYNEDFIETIFTVLTATPHGRQVLADADAMMENSLIDAFDPIHDIEE